MPVNKKELLNAPSWADEIEKLNECARVARFLKNNPQEAYSLDEIRRGLSIRVAPSSVSSLNRADLVGMRAGMYYVKDKSKCKKLVKLADI